MARQLRRADYDDFDLLIGMDEENLRRMKRMLGEDPEHKIHRLMEYTEQPDAKIADPWYTRQFAYCADQIITGCQGLLDAIIKILK
jgi:protein-tyrosine phosphatase